MAVADGLPGRTVLVGGKEYLYFSGTSYLGIPHNEEFRQHLTDGIQHYGTNYSSSRLSNLKLDIYEEAELKLAEFIGTEGSVTVSSGYLAGQMVLAALNKNAKFCYAPFAHPALLRGDQDFHTDGFENWMDKLLAEISTWHEGEVNIFCNSVDPLTVKKISFDWIKELPADKTIKVIIDDSHGLGIIGKEGRGINSILPPSSAEIIIVSSMGKALGIPGGVVAGNRNFIEKVKANRIFGGSSPIVPAYLYAYNLSTVIYERARNKLLQNTAYFKEAVKGAMFHSIDGFPVFFTELNELEAKLESHGIIISSFPYLTPADSLITRVVLNALHERADLEALLKAIFENFTGSEG